MAYVGLHMQDPVRDWDKIYGAAHAAGNRFRILKSFHPEDYRKLQEVSPGTRFVHRPWLGNVHQGAWIDRAGRGWAEANAAADEYLDRFCDSVNQYCGTEDEGLVYVESLNEEYPTHNLQKLQNIVAFDRAFVRRLKTRMPGARPVVFCAAVGNPDHDEYVHLVDLARDTAAAKGAFGYHGYWTVYKGHTYVGSLEHLRDLQLRWDVIDSYLRIGYGIRVKWFIGESGATGCNSYGYGAKVLDGWKHADTWGGDRAGYLSDIIIYDRICSQTQAAREGRFLGWVIFTSRPGDGGQWKYFNVTGEMLRAVGDFVSSSPSPGPDPEPDPEPDPDPDPGSTLPEALRAALWDVSVQKQVKSGISLNARALLQRSIFAHGFVPVTSEGRFRWEGAGGAIDVWAWQPAERPNRLRRVYVCRAYPDGTYGPVLWFNRN